MAINEAGERATRPTSPLVLAAAWIAVGVPLVWGVAQTFQKALALFT